MKRNTRHPRRMITHRQYWVVSLGALILLTTSLVFQDLKPQCQRSGALEICTEIVEINDTWKEDVTPIKPLTYHRLTEDTEPPIDPLMIKPIAKRPKHLKDFMEALGIDSRVAARLSKDERIFTYNNTLAHTDIDIFLNKHTGNKLVEIYMPGHHEMVDRNYYSMTKELDELSIIYFYWQLDHPKAGMRYIGFAIDVHLDFKADAQVGNLMEHNGRTMMFYFEEDYVNSVLHLRHTAMNRVFKANNRKARLAEEKMFRQVMANVKDVVELHYEGWHLELIPDRYNQPLVKGFKLNDFNEWIIQGTRLSTSA